MKNVGSLLNNSRHYLVLFTLAVFALGVVLGASFSRPINAQSTPAAVAPPPPAEMQPPPANASPAPPEPTPPPPSATELPPSATNATTPPVETPPPPPQITELKITGFDIQEISPDTVKFQASFASAVRKEDLENFLLIADAQGTPAAKTIGSVSPSASVFIAIPKSTPLPVTFTFKTGLTDASAQAKIMNDTSFVYPAPAPLEVSSARWSDISSGKDVILLSFSAPASSAFLDQWVKIFREDTNDPVTFSVYRQGRQATTYLILDTNNAPPSYVRVHIDAGMPGDKLSVLAQPFDAKVYCHPKPLSISHSWWGDAGVDGPYLNLELNERVKIDEFLKCLAVEPVVANLKAEYGDENTLKILGDWQSDTAYTLKLAEGMKEAEGSICTTAPLSHTLEKTPRISGLKFGQQGKIYIPRKGLGQITALARNVSGTTVNLWQIFPNNLIPAFEYSNGEISANTFNDRWAKLAGQKSIAFPATPDVKNIVPIDLNDLLPADRKGVFTLQFAEAQDWRSINLILWTNIGLLAHWENDELAVFAHDLFSLEPLAQAKVTVYSHKNQVMGVVNTDAQGIATLNSLDNALGRPRMVVVETGNDYTFLTLDSRDEDPVAFKPEMPRYNPKAYDAYLFADRNLYRPGETLHARWIVRTNYGDALTEVPLELRLINPKNQTVWTQPTTLSACGTGDRDIATEKTYLTGKYTLELRVPGAQTALGAMTFNLEEFVPNRIKTDIVLEQNRWVAEADNTITVNAQHLFGAPAAGLKCETNIILRRGEFKSDAWSGFHFGNDADYTSEVVSLGEGLTDEAGNAAFSYTYKPNPKVTFPVDVTVRGEAFELGGRSVTGTGTAILFPSNVCLGLNATQGQNETVDIAVAAIHPDETPADLASVQVTVEKQIWHYYLRRYDDYYAPNWSCSFEEIETRDVPLSEGRGTTSFHFSDYYGYYRVRVHAKETPQFSTLSFYKYWRGLELAKTARPSLIKLTLGKPEYNIGEEMIARIESPFDGKGIVVVQGEKIHKVLPITVQNGVAEIRLPLLREYYPNIWLEATVAHEVKTERMGAYPYSSFAMINAPVRDPMRRIQIAYPGLPQEVRPNQEIEIPVETKNAAGQPVAAEITLAAVDEGIHAILDYQDPDPATWFERSRKPDYRRAHYYDKVAYDFEGPPIGGDMIARRLGKGNPQIDENWIKPVALWSGAVQTDPEGKASVKFALPEFNGQLRLVAVAASPIATGAHSEKMFVRRPYILRTSMPRFALPGDRFKCSATVLNTTGAPCTARLRWKATGTLIAGEGSQEMALTAKGDASAQPDFAAGPVMGQGGIQWDAEIRGQDGQVLETLTESAPIPVRPPAVYRQDHQFAALEPGQSLTFKNVCFVENPGLDNAIVVSANPFIRLADSLKWLIEYPHGCVEQTTSRCMPMYALRKAAALNEISGMDTSQLKEYLQAGIDRLFTMQIASGGFSLWPGGVSEYPYGSVYACHFLTMAHRDRELTVPEANFKRLQFYVRGLANNADDNSPSGLYLRAYALYVLALGGDLESLQQIARFDAIPLPRASRYLLAAALAINTQDAARVQTYLDTAPTGTYNQRETSHTLNSDIRNNALELIALIHMNAAQEKMREKITPLVNYIENRAHYTTQEVAFVASALGLYLSIIGENADLCSGTISMPGGEKQINGATVFSDKRNGPCSYVVNNTGKGPLFVDFTTGGTPAQPNLTAVEKGLAVSRIFHADGNNQGALVFKQGETCLIEVNLKTSKWLENIVVSDLLPAGFEIENPRLDADALTGKNLSGALTPAHLEIRDDRLVVAFDRIPQKEQHFYYLVRAVTPGVFQYPGIQAECMYDPEIQAAGVPTVVTIE